MSTYPTTIRTRHRGRSGQRGSLALAAVTALVIVFIISISLLTLGVNTRLSGKRTMRLSGAQAMATAGVEYGYWQRVYNGQPLPYTNSRTLGSGRFTVTVTDNNAATAGTLKIVSTGTQSGDSAKLTRVLPANKSVFDYALCSGADLNSPKVVTTGSSGANGDVGANGNISLNASGTVVNGNATATKSIDIKSITGTQTPNSAGTTFPAIDATYYQSIATYTYYGDQTFVGSFTFPPPSNGMYPVIVINGNVTIGAGTISGIGTVVITGNVTFTGSFSYLYSTDKVAFLIGGSIINAAPTGTALSIVGFYYAHNNSGNATFQQPNTATMTINGSMAADKYTVNGPLTATHDSAMNASFAQQLRLPGFY